MAVFSKLRGGSKSKDAAKPAEVAVPFKERQIYVPRHAARDAMQCVPGAWTKDQSLYDRARLAREERELRDRELDAITPTAPRMLNPKLSRHSSYMSLYAHGNSPLPSPGLSNPFASGRSSFQSLSALGYPEPVPAIPARYASPISAGPSSVSISRASSYQHGYHVPLAPQHPQHHLSQSTLSTSPSKMRGTSSHPKGSAVSMDGLSSLPESPIMTRTSPETSLSLPELSLPDFKLASLSFSDASPVASLTHSSRASTSSVSSEEAIEMARVPRVDTGVLSPRISSGVSSPRIDSGVSSPALRQEPDAFAVDHKLHYQRVYPNDPRQLGKQPMVDVGEIPQLPIKKYFSHPTSTVVEAPAPLVEPRTPKKKRFSLMRRSQAVAAC